MSQHKSTMNHQSATIFVSLASFRDEYLPFTIDCVLRQARHPEHLRFGICWQSEAGESLGDHLSDPRFRVLRYPYQESLGYGWSRAEVQRLYRGETYHLLIDSHSYLCADWDVLLIDELECKPIPKPILTTSSPPFRFGADGEIVLPWAGTPYDGVPRMKCQQHPPAWLDVQMSSERSMGPDEPTCFLCFNFLFTHGRWITDVPEDPQMLNAMHEGALTVRSWTHGYDFFLPDELRVWHVDYNEYEGGVRHKVWDTSSEEWQHAGTTTMIQRLEALYTPRGDPSILGPYGLGSERQVEAWAELADVDLDFTVERQCSPRLPQPPALDDPSTDPRP